MVAPVRTVSGPKILSDLLKWEAEPGYCRDSGVLLASNPVTIGAALGRITLGAVSAAAKSGGNTGNGVFTIDATTPKLAGAKVGVYTVRCIAAATNSGTFRVTDPNGLVLGDVAVGATFADRIKFAIADGSTDFIVGDGFDVTIAAGSLKITPLNLTALDGSATCIGFSTILRDPGASDGAVVYVARMAMLADSGIDWPAGISAGQIAQAYADVAPYGIIARSGM